MNCPKCGHPADHHGYEGCMYPHKPDDIGDDYECLCNKTQEEIERAAWKAEAMAARELLSMSTFETHATDVFARCDYCNTERWAGHEEDCRYRVAKDAYLAARVKDE